jgi:hypothetical protein
MALAALKIYLQGSLMRQGYSRSPGPLQEESFHLLQTDYWNKSTERQFLES